MESKPIRGFYVISVSAIPSKADPKLIGNTGAQVFFLSFFLLYYAYIEILCIIMLKIGNKFCKTTFL